MELARSIVDLASEKQASDIVLLDIHRVSILADYFVIASGNSTRQLNALSEDILEMTEKAGVTKPRIEGNAESGWILMDYNDVIIHLFSPEQRDYYRLERLWSEALPVVRMQ